MRITSSDSMPQRILIVEDDPTLAGLLAAVLQDAGYESEVVTTPEAVATIRGPFDLVVTDYLAPAFVPGQPWPYVERLRALSQGGVVLGCTGHQEALSNSPRSLGIAAVTSKPFDVEELLTTVERLLEQGQRIADASPVSDHLDLGLGHA